MSKRVIVVWKKFYLGVAILGGRVHARRILSGLAVMGDIVVLSRKGSCLNTRTWPHHPS